MKMSNVYLLLVLLYLHTNMATAKRLSSKSIVGIFDREELSVHFADAVNAYANNKTR